MPKRAIPAAEGLYAGRVMHHRLAPVRHRFVYKVFSLLVDIDRLDALDRALRLFSYNRRNLVSFYDRDHGARDGSPLRPWVMAQLAKADLDFSCGRILLFCFPRLWGYVFNPISLYYCFDRSGRLGAIVCEVKNTFGGQHAYVLPAGPDRDDEPVRHSATKGFYVSPFIEMDARYQFRITPPGERLALMISQWGGEGSRLVATLQAKRRPLVDRALAWAALRDPLMSLKIIVGIHLEAFVLWVKGAKLKARPEPVGAPVRHRGSG
ncbi:MAG: DUF1365 domain-containing protein [Pseudomonadota bacterium]